MTRLCLDTSAYSHFRRGESRVVGHVDQASWIGIPSVVRANRGTVSLSGTG